MTESELAEACELLSAATAVLRERKKVADAKDRLASAATKANSEARQSVNEGVLVVRELVFAMTDGAGSDGKHPVAEAFAAARAFLGHEPEPADPEAADG